MLYYTSDLFCCGQIIDLLGEGLMGAEQMPVTFRPSVKKLVGVTDPRAARVFGILRNADLRGFAVTRVRHNLCVEKDAGRAGSHGNLSGLFLTHSTADLSPALP